MALTVPSNTELASAPRGDVMSTPLFTVVMPSRSGCSCTPKDWEMKPRSTGQGRLPLFFENAPPMARAWGDRVFSFSALPVLPLLDLAELDTARAFLFLSASISRAINRLISLLSRAMAFSLSRIRSLSSSSLPESCLTRVCLDCLSTSSSLDSFSFSPINTDFSCLTLSSWLMVFPSDWACATMVEIWWRR